MAAATKTQPTDVPVETFLAGVTPAVRAADARVVCAMMGRLSGEPAVMWGPSIVGFGRRRYRTAAGREGELPRIGFSPRKTALVFYLEGVAARRDVVIARLGAASMGAGCLYVKRLADIDAAALEALIGERRPLYMPVFRSTWCGRRSSPVSLSSM
jgi:hypothetical protein